jgi:hypothetical protein
MKKIIFKLLFVFILLNAQLLAKVDVSDEKILELGENYVLKFVQENAINKNIKLENFKSYISFKDPQDELKHYNFKGEISGLNLDSNNQNGKFDFMLTLKKNSDTDVIKKYFEENYGVSYSYSYDIKGVKESGYSDEERKIEIKKYVKSKFKNIIEPEIRGVNSTIHFLDGAMSFISKYTVVTEDSLIHGSIEFKEFNKTLDECDKFKLISNCWDIKPILTEKIHFPTTEDMKALLKIPLFKEVKKVHLMSGGKGALPFTSKNMSITFFPKVINNNGILFEVKSTYKLGLLFTYKTYDLTYEVPLEYDSEKKAWVISEENLEITGC